MEIKIISKTKLFKKLNIKVILSNLWFLIVSKLFWLEIMKFILWARKKGFFYIQSDNFDYNKHMKYYETLDYYQNRIRINNKNYKVYVLFRQIDTIGKVLCNKGVLIRFEECKYRKFENNKDDKIFIPRELIDENNNIRIKFDTDGNPYYEYSPYKQDDMDIIIFYKEKYKIGFIMGAIISAIIGWIIGGGLNQIIKIIEIMNKK